jgi:mannose-6-phosphate isomerase-like protein (cupin superfamily)
VDEKRYSCAHLVSIEQEPRHHLVIENEFVRAFAVEIAPYDRTLCHYHSHDYLLYVVGDGQIVSAARDEEPKQLSYRDGECELSPAGLVHVVENLRDTPFRNVVVELLPGTGSLRRGDHPKVVAGEASITQHFADERAAIFAVDMKAGSEVEVPGRVVVASPYAHQVELENFRGDTVKLCEFKHIAWLWSPPKATLRNIGESHAKAVLFQIGHTDQQGVAVLKARDPVRTLRAHADDSE